MIEYYFKGRREMPFHVFLCIFFIVQNKNKIVIVIKLKI